MNNFQSNSEAAKKEMLQSAGEKNINGLFSMIDKSILMRELDLPDAMSEMQVQRLVKSIAKENKTDFCCFMGGGAYKRFIPAAISQIASRFEFNTAYTPYQPEISQGTLQVIYEFQSMICDITGMEACNASVYDAGTACAEAVLMACRLSGKKKFIISGCLNPQYISIIKTYAHAGGILIEETKETNFETDFENLKASLSTGDYAGVLVQNPNFYGTIEDMDKLSDIIKAQNAMLMVCIEPISASVLKKPSEYKADIVTGDVQPLGNPLSFGGPYAGFIAVLDKYKRQLAGRIAGRTLDEDGKQAFTLTLQAREQHIRREKATSNICSNQGLAVLNAVVYLALSGKKGVTQAAFLSSKNAHTLAKGLGLKGFRVLNSNFFNEFVLEVQNSDKFIEDMKKRNILAGLKLTETTVLVCTTEINTEEDIQRYIKFA